MKLSLKHWRDISIPRKTPFSFTPNAPKIACGNEIASFFLGFLPKRPSQVVRWFLELEATQESPKQLKSRFQRALTKGQWSSKWSGDSPSSLHIKHLFTKILPLFCKLSQIKNSHLMLPNKKRPWMESPISKWASTGNNHPKSGARVYKTQRKELHMVRHDRKYPLRIKIPSNWIKIKSLDRNPIKLSVKANESGLTKKGIPDKNGTRHESRTHG